MIPDSSINFFFIIIFFPFLHNNNNFVGLVFFLYIVFYNTFNIHDTSRVECGLLKKNKIHNTRSFECRLVKLKIEVKLSQVCQCIYDDMIQPKINKKNKLKIHQIFLLIQILSNFIICGNIKFHSSVFSVLIFCINRCTLCIT